MDRFFDDLQARFRLSTTENLTAEYTFHLLPGETPETMIARFNMLAKPLKEEQPKVMTKTMASY